MELRLAVASDLLDIKIVYREIIRNMNNNDMQIWDDIYPCEFFSCDIENNALYILTDEYDVIVGAFVLCEENAGEQYVKWDNNSAKSLYIDRLGVNVKYLNQGIGSLLLAHAAKVAKNKNAEYLRLFVVDINIPAINLYVKKGFMRADGIYEERLDDDCILCEYGFEKRL